ncbi:MAG TPA: class I SAM-dependent methyltransferase [Bryobacteraceae bacterium]|nr:class I SAM-dependent methyltransferase [Bryobacteraceae bacterium]
MDQVKRHFEDEAREFDRVIVSLIPHYAEMLDALVSAVPFQKSARIRAIDLGCGTGTVASRILDDFPNAEMTCLDLAQNMLDMARAKLARHHDVRYFMKDFETFEFDEEYDVVISSLALHHLPADNDKRILYTRVRESLTLGGVFYNADIVLGSSGFLQSVNMNQWRAHMRLSISDSEIESTWLRRYQEEDCPAKLMDQLEWMREIGFADVDVIWKRYNFAVYGGVRR